MTATSFDLNRKTNQTISGTGNLTATSTGAGAAVSSRVGQDNFYCEFTPTTVTGTPQVGLIVLNPGTTTTSLQALTSGIGYDPSGAVKFNGTLLGTAAAWAANNRIDMAVNLRMKLIWFRVAGGNWNNDVIANQNPATNTGGFDFSSMTIMGSFLAAVYASLTGTVWVAAFSSGSWAGTAPSGYGSLDAVNSNAVKVEPDSRYFATVAADAVGSNGLFRAQPTDVRSLKYFTPAGPITMVSGTTKENGSLVATKKVEVYDRITGELVNSGFSDGSGNWSLAAVGRSNVRIVSSDPTTYNSQVFDDVTPV